MIKVIFQSGSAYFIARDKSTKTATQPGFEKKGSEIQTIYNRSKELTGENRVLVGKSIIN